MHSFAQPARTATAPSPRLEQCDAVEALKALVAEHPDLRVVEWDPSTLPADLRDGYLAHYLERKDGTRILVVPTGQDPTVRLHAVRTLLAHPGVTAL